MKNVLRSVIGAGVLGVVLVGGVGCSGNGPIADLVEEAKPEIIAVSMHADWCGSCKQLEPRVASAREELGGRKVQWVTADVTDRTNPIGKRTLEKLGLGEVFAQYGNRTGIVVLVDAETREVLKVIKSGGSTKESIVQDVRDAIAIAG